MGSHLSLFLFYILPRWTFLGFILQAVIVLFGRPRFFIPRRWYLTQWYPYGVPFQSLSVLFLPLEKDQWSVNHSRPGFFPHGEKYNFFFVPKENFIRHSFKIRWGFNYFIKRMYFSKLCFFNFFLLENFTCHSFIWSQSCFFPSWKKKKTFFQFNQYFA